MSGYDERKSAHEGEPQIDGRAAMARGVPGRGGAALRSGVHTPAAKPHAGSYSFDPGRYELEPETYDCTVSNNIDR